MEAVSCVNSFGSHHKAAAEKVSMKWRNTENQNHTDGLISQATLAAQSVFFLPDPGCLALRLPGSSCYSTNNW